MMFVVLVVVMMVLAVRRPRSMSFHIFSAVLIWRARAFRAAVSSLVVGGI